MRAKLYDNSCLLGGRWFASQWCHVYRDGRTPQVLVNRLLAGVLSMLKVSAAPVLKPLLRFRPTAASWPSPKTDCLLAVVVGVIPFVGKFRCTPIYLLLFLRVIFC